MQNFTSTPRRERALDDGLAVQRLVGSGSTTRGGGSSIGAEVRMVDGVPERYPNSLPAFVLRILVKIDLFCVHHEVPSVLLYRRVLCFASQSGQ